MSKQLHSPEYTELVMSENKMDAEANSTQRPVTVIIGAGITGLAAAYELSRSCPDMQIRIIEKDKRVGGVIKSLADGELLIECGPESFSTLKPELLELAKLLKIDKNIVYCNQENRRSFLSLDRTLHPLPEGFMFFVPSDLLSFAFSDIISVLGKIRMSLDLFLPGGADIDDESLSSFVTRRLGSEALTKLAEPMIGGIYGGDPELLSANSTVPQLVALEKKHGSIIRGLMLSQKQSKMSGTSGPRYSTLASFDKGISLLVSSLIKELPKDCLLTGRAATHIRRGVNGKRWTVFCDDNSLFSADYIVLAAPAQICANLLSEVNPLLSNKLSQIPRSQALIINLLYERKQVKHKLDGFGFVVPRSEGMLVSACSFSSIKFQGRSSADTLLFRVFTGGTQKAGAMQMSDDELVEQCHKELQEILQISGKPIRFQVSKHSEAIPQYLVGHNQILKGIETDLKESPGIELAGNSYIGVGLSDCIKSANNAATKIIKALNV